MAKERESNKEREDKLDSASKKLDSTVEEFRNFVTEFGKINKDVANKFKKTLSSTEKAQLDVFAAASNIQRQYNSIFDGMETAGDTFSAQGAFLVDNIVNTTDKAFKANRAEAKQLRKDIESMRASSVHLHGEERAKVEAMIDTAVDQLKAVSGGVSVFKEAVRKRFDPANMVEKLFGGGMIGGMFGDMIRISRERKKTAAMTEMQTQTLGGPVSAGQQAIIKELQNVRESIVSTADPKQNELFAEEKEREAGRKSIGKAGMALTDVDIDVDSGGRFADMLSAMMWSKWLPMVGTFLKVNLLAPLWVGFSHFVLLPLKTLFLKFLIAPLASWGSAFIAKLAASKMWGAISGVGKRAAGSGIGQAIIGKRFTGGQFMPGGSSGIHGGRAVAGGQRSGLAGFIGRGFQKIKGAPAAAKAARSPASMVGAATKSAGKATSAAGAATSRTPKKGILKSLADGIKSFGRKGIMRGVLNLGLLAIALIPFAFAMKLFSSGVTMGGILAFAASITVMVVAVKALSKMGSEVVKGALALSILGVALVPLAFGLALMKDVGIGTIFVLAGALLVLGVAASIFGGMAANPFFWLGILAIAALGVALLPLAFAMKIAAEAFQIFTEALDIEKMLALGPMLMFAAPGLLAFGLASLFASPGLIYLAFASMLLTASKAAETLPPLLESFAEFSERINPSNLFRGALGIVALGGALLAFTAAGVAAQALATLGGVASNFMTLGGLLGAAAPGPFDMLKMFIAFGEHGDGIGRGADGIEKLRNSMASFATMDTEGIKEGVTSVIDAIDEFSRAAFRAAFYGGIGNFLLGADPLDSFIMLAKVGPGIGAGADGIKRLGEAFTEFSKLGQSGAMSFFQEGIVSESGFENLMEALSGSLSEINEDEFETKIALLERLANAMNALARGKPMQPIQAGQGAAEQGKPGDSRMVDIGEANDAQITNLEGGRREIKTFRPVIKNRDPAFKDATEKIAKAGAKRDSQKALAKMVNEGDAAAGDYQSPSVKIEEIDGQRVAIATIIINPSDPGETLRARRDAMAGQGVALAPDGASAEDIRGMNETERLERKLAMAIEEGPVSSSKSAKKGYDRKIATYESAIAEARQQDDKMTAEQTDKENDLIDLYRFREEIQKEIKADQKIIDDPDADDFDKEGAEAWIDDNKIHLMQINAEISEAEGTPTEARQQDDVGNIEELRQQVEEDEGFFGKGNSPWQQDLDEAEARQQDDVEIQGLGHIPQSQGQGERFTGGRQKAAQLTSEIIDPPGSMGNSQVTDLGDGKIEVKSFVPLQHPRQTRGPSNDAKIDAQKALAMELGILEGDPSGNWTAKMPPGSVPRVKIEEIDGQKVAVATLTFNPVESAQLGVLRDEMNAMGGSRGSAAGLGVGGPQDLANRALVGGDIGSNPASMQGANESLNAGAVATSNRTNAAGAQQSGPVVVNTASNINNAADTFFTQNPSTRNNESSLQKATRRMYDDSDI